ncbi:MAG TPA: polyprenyl synthetase family protein [Candidatus Stackebrandtia faecavium]|nr:polyprenyl synthetase family protein [Candidatus Stackebrandtia faecavium]
MDSPVVHLEFRRRIEEALATFLRLRRHQLLDIDEALESVADAAQRFILSGGKRVRPAFAFWGYMGSGGQDSPEVIECLASLEMLQAAALIHDDLMDDSDTRRGEPAVHRQFAQRHIGAGWAGSARDFGASAAILLGDLCMTWSDEMFTASGMPRETLAGARADFDAMRTEVSAGQYLDVLTQAQRDTSTQRAFKVARYKSAKYTIERPLLLGAALAGGTSELRESYSAIGVPLGEAFQFRDDVLGVFGDPAETGKPAGDDLREGKRTYLIACSYEAATPAQRAILDAGLGNPDLDSAGVNAVQQIIVDTGALTVTEDKIKELFAQTSRALSDAKGLIEPNALVALNDLAVSMVHRTV